MGKHKGKRQVRRQNRGWNDNIKMDLKQKEWSAWIGLIWLRIRTSEDTYRHDNDHSDP